MAENNFTYQVEYSPPKGSYSPFLSTLTGTTDFPTYQPIFNPFKIKKQKIIKELSREERTQLKKRKTLEKFRQRFIDSELPGNEYGMAYLEQKNRQGLAANTIRSGGSIALSFLSFIHSNGRSLEEVSKADLEAYVESDQDKGVSIVTVNTKIRGLYTFMSFLVDRQVVAPGILTNKLKVKLPDPLPRSIANEDVEKLLSVLDETRDRAIILLLLRTGMRIGELLELQVADISLNEQKIMIYVGEKNYQGRVVYFSNDAKEALLAWLELRAPERKYLFYGPTGNPLTYVAAWYRITKCFKKAGFSNKNYSPHCLRHTFATEALNAGMRLEVVQQILGHMNIEITRRYARLTDNTREEEYFRAMTKIEQGGTGDEANRLNSQLQAVFEKKKLLTAHN